MNLETLDIVILAIYAVGIFVLAQWVSREKGTHQKDAQDYFLASRSLPWWAIGASLIAANISAEQFIGMSGSGFMMGIAVASFEWIAALTLIIVGVWILPIYLKNRIYTMPEFLDRRYSQAVRHVMTIFWLALYVFVNLTSILWLGALAMNAIAGLDIRCDLRLGRVCAAISAVRWHESGRSHRRHPGVVLIIGGLATTYIALTLVSDHFGMGKDAIEGFKLLLKEADDQLPHDAVETWTGCSRRSTSANT